MTVYTGQYATAWVVTNDSTVMVNATGTTDGVLLDTNLDNHTSGYKYFCSSNPALRIWDSNQTFTFQKRDTPTSSWVDINASDIAEVQYMGGIVIMKASLLSTSQLRMKTGGYYAGLKVLEATNWQVSYNLGLYDAAVLGDIWKKNVTGIRGGQFQLTHWWDTDITFYSLLGKPMVLAVYVDTHANLGYMAWGVFTQTSVSPSTENAISEPLTFNVNDIIYQVNGGANELPIASFTTSGTTGVAPLTVNFTDTSHCIPAAQSFVWDFGDGSTQTTITINGTTVTNGNTSHTYTQPGIYNVTETVYNAAGYGRNQQVSYVIVGAIPTAGFSASPSGGAHPLMVQFTDNSTGNPTGWAWQFDSTNVSGHGSTATAYTENPYYIYTAAGTYVVSMTATNQYGTSTAVTKTIVIT